MRHHHHYLKGTLWCAACHAQGTDSRLILQRTVGSHGSEYLHFFCIARQSRLCDSSYHGCHWIPFHRDWP
jgi:site-specific DNA recombinase